MLWTSSQQLASVLQAMAEVKQSEARRIGSLIACLRERKAWSQQDLAGELDVSVSTISRWERGLHQGYGPNVRRLAEKLGVEPAVLLPPPDALLGSQLDRIEQRLEDIYALLTDDGEPVEPGLVADAVAPLVETVESHSQTTPAPRRSRRAGKPRKIASG